MAHVRVGARARCVYTDRGVWKVYVSPWEFLSKCVLVASDHTVPIDLIMRMALFIVNNDTNYNDSNSLQIHKFRHSFKTL